MELIFLNEDGTEEITRTLIQDQLAEKLVRNAEATGMTLEEYVLQLLDAEISKEEVK